MIAAQIKGALNRFNERTPRTKQSRDGILGPSDIGFCRMKALLTLQQAGPLDPVDNWSAMVGTAIHNYVEEALKADWPSYTFGSQGGRRVTATLPSGAKISGTPDMWSGSLDDNCVYDIKTVNGFEWTKRNGPSLSHIYQRHLYALALIQEDSLTEDCTVGNIYMDRSGANSNILVIDEKYNPDLTAEIDTWVTDVIYAAEHGEETMRDVAAPVCEKICSYFTVCRGSLEDTTSEGPIHDKDLLSAVDMYVEGHELHLTGGRMKNEAKSVLAGVSGVTPTHQVRWVQVNGKDGPYDRLDVRSKKIV